MHLDGLDPEFHRYPGTRQWFFEDDREEHDPEAAALAWERTVAFLHAHVPPI
jgi:carboxymethylenebutenolidase